MVGGRLPQVGQAVPASPRPSEVVLPADAKRGSRSFTRPQLRNRSFETSRTGRSSQASSVWDVGRYNSEFDNDDSDRSSTGAGGALETPASSARQENAARLRKVTKSSGLRVRNKYLGRNRAVGHESCLLHGCSACHEHPPWREVPQDATKVLMQRRMDAYRVDSLMPPHEALRARGGPQADNLLFHVPQLPIPMRRPSKRPKVDFVQLTEEVLSKVLPPICPPSSSSSSSLSSSPGDVVPSTKQELLGDFLRTWESIWEQNPAQEASGEEEDEDAPADLLSSSIASPFEAVVSHSGEVRLSHIWRQGPRRATKDEAEGQLFVREALEQQHEGASFHTYGPNRRTVVFESDASDLSHTSQRSGQSNEKDRGKRSTMNGTRDISPGGGGDKMDHSSNDRSEEFAAVAAAAATTATALDSMRGSFDAVQASFNSAADSGHSQEATLVDGASFGTASFQDHAVSGTALASSSTSSPAANSRMSTTSSKSAGNAAAAAAPVVTVMVPRDSRIDAAKPASTGGGGALALPPDDKSEIEVRTGSNNRGVRTLRSSVKDRLARIQSRRFARQQQQEAEMDDLRRRFNQLPASEVAAIQKVFDRFDQDGSGKLDCIEVSKALRDLGLRGSNVAEKQEILRVCQRPGSYQIGSGQDEDRDDPFDVLEVSIDIFSFALQVIPQVRGFLALMTSNDMARYFCQYDYHGYGRLGAEQCMEIGLALNLDLNLLRSVLDERPKLGKKDKGVDLEEFRVIVGKCKEQAERVVRQREHEIKEHTGINHKTFLEFRQDIVALYELFSSLDSHGSGNLKAKEIRRVVDEFGLTPKTPKEKAEVQRILRESDVDKDGYFNFHEFLFLVKRIRAYNTNISRDRDYASFLRYDRDGNGKLSVREICNLLDDLGAVPHNRQEQEELAALIQSVDEDGSGFIDFSEFQVLLQRIEERLRSSRFEEEVEYGMRAGFSESQLYDLRFAFESLDADGSGRLDKSEIRHCLHLLEKKVSQDVFESTFKALDEDASGELDFREFLAFIDVLGEGETDLNVFPSKIRGLEQRVIRRILEIFGQRRYYVAALPLQDAVHLVCQYLDIRPDDSLYEVLQVRSIAELLDLAKARAKGTKAKFGQTA